MKFKNKIGNHQIFTYNQEKYNFLDFFYKLYNTEDLQNLHLKSTDYHKKKDLLDLGVLNDNQTDLHDIFYHKIKNDDEFKKLYCQFIQHIYTEFFPNEKYILYQSFPSIRIQYPQSVAIPPHKDSDSLSNHPIGEKNFLIPITEMKNTNSVYIESEPDKKDFQSIHLEPGDVFYFNGNLCTHYNEKNNENKLRISLDFRIMLLEDYHKYIKNWNLDIVSSNPRDIIKKRDPTKMIAGGYYQITYLQEPIEKMLNWYNVNFIMQHRPTFKKNFINNNFLMDLMDNEEKKVFKDNLKSNNLNNFKLCLQIFIKYFDKYYYHLTKYELNGNILNLNFDGHLSCQTDSIVYSEDILKRCNIIKTEELNSIENKKILKILFNTEILENKTKTVYPLNKNEYLTEEYIALINKYYKKDFDFFNYEIK